MLTLLNTRFWAIEPQFFSRAKDIVLHRLNTERDLGIFKHRELDLSDEKGALLQLKSKVSAGATMMEVEWDREAGLPTFITEAGKRVAYIPIKGGLTKNGDLCSYGMIDHGHRILRADASKKVDAILLDMDTPGGSVDGTPELASIIANTGKPTAVFTDGMLASAGIWLSSQADQIVANSLNFNEIGSIGTLMMYVNYSKYIEREIGSVEIIRAPQSKDKARLNSFEQIPEGERTKLMEELEMITDKFIEAVKTGRGDRLNPGKENIFSGKTYDQDRALELGLIDQVGTFADAIHLAADMAGSRQQETAQRESQTSNTNNNQKSNSMNFKTTWSAILTFFGFSAAAVEAEKKELTEAHVDQLDKQLSTLTEENNNLKTINGQLTADKQQLAQSNDQLTAQVADLQAQLEKAPAGAATTVVQQQDGGHENDHKNKYETSVDRELAEYRKQIN